MINVKEAPYNATGDGTTDDSNAVEAAFAAALATPGTEVYFPVGVYNLATWTTPTLNKPLRLRGEVPAGKAGTSPGATVLKGPGTSTANKFARIAHSLSVSGLGFVNWGITFDGNDSGAVEAVTFDDCTFRDSAQFLEWAGGTGESVGRLVVDRCTFQNLTLAVVSAAMEFDAVYFTRSRVKDCKRYVLRLTGNDVVTGRELVVFSRNYVSNLNADGYTGSSAAARVVQVICHRLVVTENHVRKVHSTVGGGNANFMYQSSIHAYVAGNYLEDVGTPGDATGGIIQEKNPSAISSRYIGNLFVQNPPAPGQTAPRAPAIQMLGGGHAVVHASEGRGLQNALAYSFQNGGDLVISNNVMTDMDTPYGAIVVYGGENVVIESNVIDGVQNTWDSTWPYYARGIRLERYAEPIVVDGEITGYTYHAPRDVRIANNVVKRVKKADAQEGSGISVYLNGVQAQGLSIVGNTIAECDLGVDLRVAGTGSFLDTELSYNTFRDNRVAVYAPTPPVAFTTRDNRGWATEASGTASVAAGTTSIAVSHGLARTPPLSGITVTPASAPDTMGASRFWIGNVTATTFTINVDSAPGAAVSFAWTAQIL